MSLKTPEGTDLKKAAAWETIVASILLGIMIIYKCIQLNFDTKQVSLGYEPLSKFVATVMGENKNGPIYHIILYVVLFILVFSSSIMGFFYEDNQ